MWKEILPEKCPPESANEVEKTAFRIIKDKDISESDFYPHYILHPNNKRYKGQCAAYALSFFDSLKNCLSTYENIKSKNIILGSHIIKVEIKKECGKTEINTFTGHLSVWFYKTWDFNHFEILDVIPINNANRK